MKIKFVQQHIVRGQTRAEDIVYEEGQIEDFGKDPVANSYAAAYIDRGYAVAHDETVARAAEKVAREEQAKVEAEARAKAEAEEKARLEAEKNKNQQQAGNSQSK